MRYFSEKDVTVARNIVDNFREMPFVFPSARL